MPRTDLGITMCDIYAKSATFARFKQRCATKRSLFNFKQRFARKGNYGYRAKIWGPSRATGYIFSAALHFAQNAIIFNC